MGVKKLCMSKVAMGCGCWLGLPDEAMDTEREKKKRSERFEMLELGIYVAVGV